MTILPRDKININSSGILTSLPPKATSLPKFFITKARLECQCPLCYWFTFWSIPIGPLCSSGGTKGLKDFVLRGLWNLRRFLHLAPCFSCPWVLIAVGKKKIKNKEVKKQPSRAEQIGCKCKDWWECWWMWEDKHSCIMYVLWKVDGPAAHACASVNGPLFLKTRLTSLKGYCGLL